MTQNSLNDESVNAMFDRAFEEKGHCQVKVDKKCVRKAVTLTQKVDSRGLGPQWECRIEVRIHRKWIHQISYFVYW